MEAAERMEQVAPARSTGDYAGQKTCHKCGKPGHLARFCRSSRRESKPRLPDKKATARVAVVEYDSEEDDEAEVAYYAMESEEDEMDENVLEANAIVAVEAAEKRGREAE